MIHRPRRRRRGLTLAALGLAGLAAQELVARRYYARTPGPTRFVHASERTAWTAPWPEVLAPAEWLALRASPVYRGAGIPGGDGRAVVLVAGFLLRGAYLHPLRGWLERIGYRATIADIGRAADCVDLLGERLLTVVDRADGAPVHLVGHSFGGLLARAAAARAGARVDTVTTLGTPLRGLRLHPFPRVAAAVVRAWTHRRRGAAVRPRCLTFACDCASVAALRTPLAASHRQLAIVTRRDGLTDWRYTLDPATMDVVEVPGSHSGLVWNAHAYRALATHLAGVRDRVSAPVADGGAAPSSTAPTSASPSSPS
jgi:pimeloyl-ACP methyl ester carboxylesterase